LVDQIEGAALPSGAASVLDRWILVPAVLVPIAISGVFPHTLLAIAVLDAWRNLSNVG
jgi:hypothetical protein